MVELSLGSWLKADEFPANKELTVKFVNEGEFVNGDFGEQFEITVEVGNGMERKWSMNKTSQRAVAERLGVETSKWVGQTAELFLADQNVDGKMKKVIYARGKV